ncbi:cytochrome-c oxidase, subunit VIIa [Ascodesmis nigricans]|uniref:Cytochrome c oxidase subunit 9, mitochondrial n=1 Tax=Ascodesmis nigricans TaxID=341454 RepID=A0A4V3SIZ8_9PEZI|nr:cytochrome-c oxidase, subunit VIIa [Ascodesmis nigricans]
MAVAPIVGRLRKGLVMDLSVSLGLGVGMGYWFWYGYHIPNVRKRDAYYAKIEQARIEAAGANQ